MRSARSTSRAALAISLLALVMATTPLADAARRRLGRVVRLDSRGKVPVKVLPKVPSARNADRVGGRQAKDLIAGCSAQAVDLGTWCLLANPYPLTPEETGRNTYFFAAAKCAELGGYLPTAAQLIGAADRVKLASTVDDDQLTASIDVDPSDGLKDRREMSATLVTTQAGSTAAGSQGVSDGARGDPKTGEPDPVPQPAVPSPETLQYVTVYDNRDKGGFAGARPVGQPELFRCAFQKAQGEEASEEG